jgi:pimeloyl-ACP methyl ester carboxylesterase
MAQIATDELARRQIVVGQLRITVVEAGQPSAPSVLCLHGWPQSSLAFQAVQAALGARFRVVAVDLPGVGQSFDVPPGADKRTLARIVRGIISQLELSDVTLVGHDIGGQIAYACMREFPEALARVAILNVAIPGIDPWGDVIRNPHIWHFGFHAVASLPELLVAPHRREYFEFFFRAIAGSPDAVSSAAKGAYAEAYARNDALRTGFDWYRAFEQDAADNTSGRHRPVDTPVLYVRGGAEQGLPIERYVAGLREAGLHNVIGRTISGAGHFTLDEQPELLSRVLEEFIAGSRM